MDGKIVQKSPRLPLGVKVHTCTLFLFFWMLEIDDQCRGPSIYKGETSSIWVNNYTWGCRGAIILRCLGFRTCFTKCDNWQIIVQIKSFNKGTMSQRLRGGQTQHRIAVGKIVDGSSDWQSKEILVLC